MEWNPHTVLPCDTPWVMWVMVMLIVLAVGVLQYRIDTLSSLVKCLFSPHRHLYTITHNDAVSMSANILLRISELALFAMLLRYPKADFSWRSFWHILLIACGVTIIRNLWYKWVEWTFVSGQKSAEMREQYTFLNRGMTCFLLPVIIVLLHFPYHSIVVGVIVGVLIMWTIMIMIKYVQSFGWHGLTICYAILYIGCFQLTPLGCIWVLSGKWM